MGAIRILEAGTSLEMIGVMVNIIKVIEETFRTETGHMIEAEGGIEAI